MNKPKNKKEIVKVQERYFNCDNIVWITDILQRYEDIILESKDYPSISQIRNFAKMSAIKEIGEILGFRLNKDAEGNYLNMINKNGYFINLDKGK